MTTIHKYIYSLVLLAFLAGCDKKNKDVVKPLSLNDFPQIILLDDEGDGNLEDDDKVGIVLTLADRIDFSGEELGGAIAPLSSDAMVSFEIKDPEGFENLSEYILDWTAFYEIDDCITSEDENIDLNLVFDPSTGKGSVRFPAGVEEIEIELELSEVLFDDDILNTDGRGFTFELTDVSSNEHVKVNTDIVFEYEVLDDEAIYGDWELDHTNPDIFAAFRSLFGLINEDIAALDASEVDKIEISFEYEEVKVLVELVETEVVEECGETETVNIEIEIEGEIEELTDDALSGEVEFAEEIEQDDESVKEFVYAGEFTISGSQLSLTLQGEYDDEESEEVTLILEK